MAGAVQAACVVVAQIPPLQHAPVAMQGFGEHTVLSPW
jgi:hypothetical protein